MRCLLAIASASVAIVSLASGQGVATKNPAKQPVAAVFEEDKKAEWSFEASVSGYVIPDDKDYLSPVLLADRDWLHLEARHNYENLDTASLWVGYNFSIGEKLVLDFTPMVGGVFSHTRGIAPGWRLALSKGSIEFTNETEFVFDAQDSENNFLYMWSELTWAPTDWMWVGLVGQRSRVFQSELDIQRGFLLGFTIKEVDFTTYVFNWGWTDPTFVFSIGMKF
ncbi:MAG: hypothetical protein K1X78_07385 [Verrucomicrobiaceae bacterium]|nr:hypothetical protein [Verrucomicrobiaceae bacterium]